MLSTAAGCRRGEVLDGTPLYAPFNQRKPVAVVNARVADGRCEVAVRSRMDGRLALRIDEILLHPQSGAPLSLEPSVSECVLAGGGRMRLVEPVTGEPAVDYEATVRGSPIPLDDPGRAMYREWAWIRRPLEIDAIDAELARLAALPPCPER